VEKRCSDGILIGTTGASKELINLCGMQNRISVEWAPDKTECRPHVKNPYNGGKVKF
jgi:hypothetical protein